MTIVNPYLGVPGSMVQLPPPNGPFDVTSSRSETVHTLIGGGTTVTKRLRARKTFSLPYMSRPLTGLGDTLEAFYLGLYGEGPFVFVDPSQRNMLRASASTMGLQPGSSHGWAASGGTLAQASTGGPTGVTSGVLTWSSVPASGVLQVGPTSSTVDTSAAPVYLPTEAVSVSLWVKASAACTCTLQVAAHNTSGGSPTGSGGSISVTTSWQQFGVTVGAGGMAGAFVVPRLVAPSSAPTTISIAAGQLEYASAFSSFQIGYGSPRVLITSSPGRTVPLYGYSDHTLTLAEV